MHHSYTCGLCGSNGSTHAAMHASQHGGDAHAPCSCSGPSRLARLNSPARCCAMCRCCCGGCWCMHAGRAWPAVRPHASARAAASAVTQSARPAVGAALPKPVHASGTSRRSTADEGCIVVAARQQCQRVHVALVLGGLRWGRRLQVTSMSHTKGGMQVMGSMAALNADALP